MSEYRINSVVTIIGKRGSGKTTFAQETMKDHQKKILIVDTFDHPAYRHIPRIQIKDLKRWKKGTYRLYGSNTEEILAGINNNLTNALVFFEDALKYISTRFQDNERNFVIDSKQKNLDLVFMFHGYGFVPADLFRFTDFITVFKTNDHPSIKKAQIPCYAEVLQAYESVMKDPSKYANRTIQVN